MAERRWVTVAVGCHLGSQLGYPGHPVSFPESPHGCSTLKGIHLPSTHETESTLWLLHTRLRLANDGGV